jgi:hypothetical protein
MFAEHKNQINGHIPQNSTFAANFIWGNNIIQQINYVRGRIAVRKLAKIIQKLRNNLYLNYLVWKCAVLVLKIGTVTGTFLLATYGI